MERILVFLTVLVLFSFSAGQSFAAESFNDSEWKQASKIYKRYCAKCHGKTAHGDGRMIPIYLRKQVKLPTDFTVGYFEDRPADYLRKVIAKGGQPNKRSEYMPPFEEELSKQEIELMVRLIKIIGQDREYKH